MLNYLDDNNFVEQAIENGKITFLVRGSLSCSHHFNFTRLVPIRIAGPTFKIYAVAENSERPDDIGKIHVQELVDEVVFRGEVELPEKTKIGISKALYVLELWADFLCLTVGNPKITIEVQRPLNAVIGLKSEFDVQSLDRWGSLFEQYLLLNPSERKKLAGTIWWYRKACSTAYYSLFDSYTAYWNCLEILCNVSGSKTREEEVTNRQIESYFKNKKKITAGHILDCYNRFVNYSIKEQMKDVLNRMMGNEQASQVIYQCFEIKPEEERLYQIRNDINHGNIRENSGKDYERVYFRVMLLSDIVLTLVNQNLGNPVSLGMTINELAEQLQNDRLHKNQPNPK